MPKKIVHLSSAHPRFDTRIFWKQCRTLSLNFEVHLIVADGKGPETLLNVQIHDVGKATSRLHRMLFTPLKIYQAARTLNAEIYHLHDPELLLIGLVLKRAKKKVIFDSHEDISSQILSKPYLSPFWKKIISMAFSRLETWVCRRLDFIIAATPFIQKKFDRLGCRAIDVNNFPLLEEFLTPPLGKFTHQPKLSVCYVGNISKLRGIEQLVIAQTFFDVKVHLAVAGTFNESSTEARVRGMETWPRVNFLGWQDRQGVQGVMADSFAGIVTLHPTHSYLNALPVKMFEYMAAGIAVICSDFPAWRQIIEEVQCGLCVDPLNPRAIASAVNQLFNDPTLADSLGKNGQRAVREKYNWSIESEKLLQVYADLTSRQGIL